MADEESDHSGSTSRPVSSLLQQKEDVSSDNRGIGEMRNRCDEATSLLQSSSPEKVHGGPLAPEVGGSTEASSKSKGSHKNKKAVLPRVKTFFGRNPGLETTRNYSRSRNNVGGVLTAEVGRSTEARSDSKGSHKNKNVVLSRVKSFHGRNPGSKATGSCSRSENNVGGVLTAEVGASTEAGSNYMGSHKYKNVVLPQVKTFHGRNPGSKAAGSCSRSESNVGGVLTAEIGGSTEVRASHKNKNVVLPRVNTFHGRNPGSKATGSYSRSANNVDGVLTAEVGGSTEARSNSKCSHKNKNVVLPRVKAFYGRNPGSKTAGSYSRSENNVDGISGQGHKVGKASSLAQDMGVHSRMVRNETQFSGPAQNMHRSTLSRNDHLAPDQVISGSRRNGLTQVSNASTGPCLRRSGNLPPPLISRAARGRIIMHPSVPASFLPSPSVAYPTQTFYRPHALPFPVQTAHPSQTQTAASHPYLPGSLYRPHALPFPVQIAHPPQTQTAASRPYLPRTVHYRQTLSRTPALPSSIQTDRSIAHLAQETSLLHISLDLNDTPPEAIGEVCFLCQRDVSLKPEGEGPAVPQVTCVLPCHHCYHAQCLESITPAEQSHDPPCILCQVNIPDNDINEHSSSSSS